MRYCSVLVADDEETRGDKARQGAKVNARLARVVWGTTQRCARDLEKVIRRHPSCWVLNYNYFRQKPTENELAQLAEQEAKK